MPKRRRRVDPYAARASEQRRKMAVLTASLQREREALREHQARKQETPSVGANEVSTNPHQVESDGTAARAKFDTDTP